ncbi:hypothetical protein ACFIQF_22605 [Comamonas sp. J-3]|uniref:hypothetical protein n=1 Tax=Comamonas trifloxystrobinivorans TaxID=3350256 RepID=UPI003726EBB3
MSKINLRRELAAEARAERFDITEHGIFFPRTGVIASGEYWDRINGGEWNVTPNLIPLEGLAQFLNVTLDPGTAKPAGHYLAISSGSAAPQANWTAATYVAAANEIVSPTEGHASPTRPVWTPTKTTTNSIDNLAAAAKLTMVTAGTLNVTGAAVLTSSQRGGVTGALMSASLFPVPRTFQNGDVWDLGYRLSLTAATA